MWLENKVPNRIKKKKTNFNKFQISIWKVEKNQEMKIKMKTCTKQALLFFQYSNFPSLFISFLTKPIGGVLFSLSSFSSEILSCSDPLFIYLFMYKRTSLKIKTIKKFHSTEMEENQSDYTIKSKTLQQERQKWH